MSEDIETRALERLMVRRGEMPPPAVTIEPPGGGEGPDVAAGPGSGGGQPTGEVTNIPRSAVMQAVGQLGSWLQAAAEQLDQVGVTVPGLGRITAKDITLGDVGQVLENISYGFGPVRGGDPAAGDLSAIPQLRPEALELLNLSILPGFGSAAARLARGAPRATAAAAGAAALAPGEAEGGSLDRIVRRAARATEDAAGGAGRRANRGDPMPAALKPSEKTAAEWAADGYQVGGFGPIFSDVADDWPRAVEALRQARTGEVPGALLHPEFPGGIDVVYGLPRGDGEKGFGLAKLMQLHPEVVDRLPDIIAGMRATPIDPAYPTRRMLVSADYTAVVVLEYEGTKKTWLLTTYISDEALAAGRGEVGSRPPPRGQTTPLAPGERNVAPRAPGDNGDVE